MSLPEYPQNLIPRPFANNGNRQLIPDDKMAAGRASFKEGFPVETQLPLNSGGIAPNRTDFNGIFHMLSSLAFWQQSGGQMVYNAALDYNVPGVVFHEGRLWWCLAPNGPSSVIPGVVPPGTNDEVWRDFFDFLRRGAGGSGGSGGEAALAVDGYQTEFRSFYEQTPPEGWAIRNGDVLTAADRRYPELWQALLSPRNLWKLKTETQWQALRTAAGGTGGAPFFVLNTAAGTVRLPDTRGDYERYAGGGAMPAVGGWHGDAIRNITGSFGADVTDLKYDWTPTGAFYDGGGIGRGDEGRIGYQEVRKFQFDASRVVPTAAENRTRAFGVLGCVYIGLPAN
jgi:hypothetical protein